MATVTASKYGTIVKQGSTSFSATRTGTGSTASNQPSTSNGLAGQMNYETGKGDEWNIKRIYLAFNVSSYASGYTITNLKLYYKPTASGLGTYKIAVIKSTAQGNASSDLATSDYYTPLDYSVDYADNDGTDVWLDGTTLSYFDLNATAIAAFSNSYVKLAIVEYTHDYSNAAPSFATEWSAYWNTSSNIPYLSFTATATGWNYGDINGVTSPSDKVIAIEYTDINHINNIPGDYGNFEGDLSGGGTYTIYYLGALDSLFSNSVLYSNSSGATALPAGYYSGFDVDVFGCSVASGCSYCIIDSDGLITESSPPCCP